MAGASVIQRRGRNGTGRPEATRVRNRLYQKISSAANTANGKTTPTTTSIHRGTLAAILLAGPGALLPLTPPGDRSFRNANQPMLVARPLSLAQHRISRPS